MPLARATTELFARPLEMPIAMSKGVVLCCIIPRFNRLHDSFSCPHLRLVPLHRRELARDHMKTGKGARCKPSLSHNGKRSIARP